MSTDQGFNEQVVVNFDSYVNLYRNGEVHYDEVEEELNRLMNDEDVSEQAYYRCVHLWNVAKAEDEEFQSEEWMKEKQLQADQGVY
jgi:hypothetical protein